MHVFFAAAMETAGDRCMSVCVCVHACTGTALHMTADRWVAIGRTYDYCFSSPSGRGRGRGRADCTHMHEIDASRTATDPPTPKLTRCLRMQCRSVYMFRHDGTWAVVVVVGS
jgi:hypothetical protein